MKYNTAEQAKASVGEEQVETVLDTDKMKYNTAEQTTASVGEKQEEIDLTTQQNKLQHLLGVKQVERVPDTGQTTTQQNKLLHLLGKNE